MIDQNHKQNKNLIFSENTYDIIGGLVEKYQLDREIEDEEGVKKGLESAISFSEKDIVKFLFGKKVDELLKNGYELDEILASRKLLKIIGSLNKDELSNERLRALLRENFTLPQEDIEGLSKELQDIIPILTIKEVADEDILEKELVLESPLIEKKDDRPKGKDIYKEKIE